MSASPSELFARFDAWRAEHAPDLAPDFAPGLSAGELDRFEAAHGLTLPADVREMYSLHNGQVEQQQHIATCVLPECFIFGQLAVMDDPRDDLYDDALSYIEDSPDHPVKPQFYSPAWLLLAHDGRGVQLLIDLDPAPSGTAGQVIDWDVEGERPVLIAPSLTRWLELWIGDLDSATPGERGLDFDTSSISATG